MIISAVVWLLRLIVGGTFVFSGFVKAVDPWGFMYKIQEYLDVWGIDWVPREATFCFSALLALVEFTAGAMLLLGCLRRVSIWVIAVLMAVMLPLSIYIAIDSPVEDCGCFGDALIISNTATMIKNIVLTALVVFLLKWNTWVDGLIIPLLQWIPATACAIYCVLLSLIGLTIQPVMDFRPYKTGKSLLPSGEGETENLKLVYERPVAGTSDGQVERREFDIDALPDSTWTYVGRVSKTQSDKRVFTIYDGNEDVTADVIEPVGKQVILTVSNPKYHNRARAGMANRINEYVMSQGGSMIGVIAIPNEKLNLWEELAVPEYPIYTADDVAIKELVRGDASIIYLEDGIIKWKRDVYSLPGYFPDMETDEDPLEAISAVDDGELLKKLSLILLAFVLGTWLLSLPVVVKWRIERKKMRMRKLEKESKGNK